MLGLGWFCWGQAGAVENCDDDDECKWVGSGKLGELGAWRDTAESMGGRDGDGSSGSFFGVNVKFDFNSRGTGEPNLNII